MAMERAKILKYKRDMKDLKKKPCYIILFVFLLIILGYHNGISVYIMCGLAVFPVLNSIYSYWVRLAEMKTQLTYLEAGIELVRD
jgi:hypothetical protein